MCVSTIYSVLSPSPVKKNHRHVAQVGFEPTTLARIMFPTSGGIMTTKVYKHQAGKSQSLIQTLV